MSVLVATITTDLNPEQAAWEAWRITRVSSFLVYTSKLRYLHHIFFHNLDAFGLLCYTELLVFTNQMLLPFPVLDEILRQVAFAVCAWENPPPVFHPIWLGMIFEKDIPVWMLLTSAPWFALSASLIDWSRYTSKTTSILWLDVCLVSTVLSSFSDTSTHRHTITFHFLHSCHGIYDCSTQYMSDSLLRCHALYTCLPSFALSS